MLHARRHAAQQIADKLFEAEAAVDAALAQTAALTQIMPEVRADAGLSALIGQDAVERACAALTALATARRALCDTHRELTVAQGQIGLGAVAFGSTDKGPLRFALDRDLRAVGGDDLRAVGGDS